MILFQKYRKNKPKKYKHLQNIKISIQIPINLVTAFVPSEIACLPSSPGKINLTEV